MCSSDLFPSHDISAQENVNLHWLRGILTCFFFILVVWTASCYMFDVDFDNAYMLCSLVAVPFMEPQPARTSNQQTLRVKAYTARGCVISLWRTLFVFSPFPRYGIEKNVFIYNKAQTFTSSGFVFPQKMCIFAENFFAQDCRFDHLLKASFTFAFLFSLAILS